MAYAIKHPIKTGKRLAKDIYETYKKKGIWYLAGCGAFYVALGKVSKGVGKGAKGVKASKAAKAKKIPQVSKNRVKHIINEHCPQKYAQTLKYKSRETVERELVSGKEGKTFFPQNWSEQTIKNAVNYGYKKALKKK